MSAFACPRCHAPSVIAPEMGVAQCASCELVYEVSAAQVEAFDEANPPVGVEVHREADTLVLTLPWSAEVTYAGHILQFAFPLAIGAMVLFGMVMDPQALLSPRDLVGALGLGVVLVGAPLYGAVCYVLNATTVRIGPDQVSVSHGPLPTHLGRVSFPAARLRDLQTRTVTVRVGRGGEVERFALGGKYTTLLTKWVYEDPLRYVLAAIRATLPPDAVDSRASTLRDRRAETGTLER